MKTNVSLQSLTKCRHLIIPFDSEAALWLSNEGEPKHYATFLFDPEYVEGERRRDVEGNVYGHLSCLTATVAAEIASNPDSPNLELAMRRGLAAMRSLRENGHGDASRPGAGFPASSLAAAAYHADASKSLQVRSFGCDDATCPVRPNWSLLALHESPAAAASGIPLNGIARRVLIQGPGALRAPTLRIGNFFTADRSEIEAVRCLRQLVHRYVDDRKSDKPLSIGVFGPPGAGESFAVKELAKDLLRDRLGWLEFNLSQFNGPADLIGALHQVRDKTLEGKIPVAFFDEFDSQIFFWLKYLLAPMQDGRFQELQSSHPVGQCLFVFAGGTSHTFEAFEAKGDGAGTPEHAAADQFVLSKGPDFASRLDGKLNVIGPNPRPATSSGSIDVFCPVRRALFIRSRLNCSDSERLHIHPSLATALLELSRFRHSSRSLTKLVEPFRLLRRAQPDAALSLSSLLPRDLLALHVDPQEFDALIRRDEETANRLGVDQLAGAVHAFYREKGKAGGWIKLHHDRDFAKLSPFDQASNRAAARRIPAILALVGLKLVAGTATAKERSEAVSVLNFHGDLLAEAEADNCNTVVAELSGSVRSQGCDHCASESALFRKVKEASMPITKHISIQPLLSACLALFVSISLATLVEAQIVVEPDGSDQNPGTEEKPLATLTRASDLAREIRTKQAGSLTILMRSGVYYLPQTLAFSPEDSGGKNSPFIIAAAPGQTPVISGGQKLDLAWKPGAAGVMEAATHAGLTIDRLWVNGKRQIMARFPNRIEGKNLFDRWDLHHDARSDSSEDALSKDRIARWKNPAGGYLHAMHPGLWGDMHWLIKGKMTDGSLEMEGGWQNNRPGPMHGKYRFVENLREELDSPGEWFHDATANTLYFVPEAGTDPKAATVEVVRLSHLIEFKGSKETPVQFIELRGLTFRHTARTFMDNKEPLLRSDWTVYRGGAVNFDGAADCTVADCSFDQVGGNTIFVNNWNRRIAVRGCLIQDSGANGVAFVGDPKAVRSPLFRYGPQDYAGLDRTPGPLTDNFPAECVVEDCLIARTGRDEKQTAPVQTSMAQDITVRHCSIYDVPRAGINISEGTWGGHLIEFCDIFNTVLETGDHGSFNSWGRDRFWDPSIQEGNRQVATDPGLPLLDVVKPVVIRNNRWRCDHGWDIDLDDGSTNYEVYNNLLLNGGLKLREGFFRKVHNNITVNNSLHPHCWYDQSHDEVTGNIFMGSYQPAGGMPTGQWGRVVDLNFFTTSENDRTRFADNGCDANSLVGDAQFIDPARGDYRVKETSPALRLGFKNFAMDQFGVQKPALKKIAKTPPFPALRAAVAATAPAKPRGTAYWLQASVKALVGEDFSAFGVSRDAGGLQLLAIPTGSAAAKAGLQTDDLLMTVKGRAMKQIGDLAIAMNEAGGKPLEVEFVRNQKQQKIQIAAYPFVAAEVSDNGTFKRIPLADAAACLPIVEITSMPGTNNEPLATLKDGKLATNYGPVYSNNTAVGLYRIDLGKSQELFEINTWSYSEGARGPQNFVLYGSATDTDPGGSIDDDETFTLIAEMNTQGRTIAKFCATSVRHSQGMSLGSFRWLILATYPLNSTGEHTAFQELQVRKFQSK